MLKVELHTHTADDPLDRIPYTSHELIDRAHALGYDALAITLHDRQLDIRPLVPYAADRGIVLIPGIERTVEGRHVLLLNFRAARRTSGRFADLRRLKQRGPGLIVAPHPFFPSSTLPARPDEHARGSLRRGGVQRDVHRVAELQPARGALGAPRTASRWWATATSIASGSSGRPIRWWTRTGTPRRFARRWRPGACAWCSSPLSWPDAAATMASLLPTVAPRTLAPASHRRTLAPSHHRTRLAPVERPCWANLAQHA